MRKMRNIILCTIVFIILTLLATTVNAASNLNISDISVITDNTKAEIEWSKANDATGYDVYIDLPAIGYQHVGRITGNKVTVIGFEAGEIYGVKVKAYDGNGNSSDFSPEVRFKIGESSQTTSKLEMVENIKTTSNGVTGTIEWDGVTNADGYEIYASVQDSDFIDIGSTSATKVRLIGMDEEEVYSIKIKPYLTEANEKVYGTFSDLAVLKYEEEDEAQIETPDKVTNLKVSMNKDEATLTWDNVTNADGYELAITIPGYQDAIYNTTDNKITLNGFTADYPYEAKVRAYAYHNGEKVYGDYSNTVDIIYEEEKVELDKVTGLKVSMSGDKASFTWNSVSNADGYEMEIAIPGVGTARYTLTETSKTLTGFEKKNSDYSMRVRAYKTVDGEKVYGDYSNTVYFNNTEEEEVTVGKVSGLKVSMSGDRASFTWNSVSNANGYEMLLSVPGVGTSTYTLTGTSKTLTGFTKKNSDYSMKVRAYKTVNGDKVYGDYSSTVYFNNTEEEEVTVGKVSGLRVSMSGERASFTWNSVSNADGYEMLLSVPGVGTSRYTVTGTSKTLTGFEKKNSDYSMKVRAFKTVDGDKVYGDYSSTVYFNNTENDDEDDDGGSTTIGKVTGLRASKSGDRATFTWNRVSGADGYEVALDLKGVPTCRYTTTETSLTKSGITDRYSGSSVRVRAYTIENGKKVYGDYSSRVTF